MRPAPPGTLPAVRPVSPARLALLLALAVLLLPASASARVPAPWLGVQADGPLFGEAVDTRSEVGLMKRSGFGSMRVALYWDVAQPYATAAEVPPDQAGAFTDEGGTPTDWSALDLRVGLATEQGLRLLPVVQRAPGWARRHPDLDNSPPSASGVGAYARFFTALVHRYGPGGAFWAAHPELPARPIRRWQVWNEPDGERDWSDQPGVADYVKLLKPSYRAIKAADPGAQVVLAGLVGRSWSHLDEVYRRGGGRFFDVAAIHPFSLYVRNVLLILRRSRDVMRRHGDAGKPLLATELSWPSAKGKTTVRYGFEVSEAGQAERLRASLRALARARRRLGLTGIFWSTWMSYDRDPTYAFDYAGLRRFAGGTVKSKPAFFAFRRVAHQLRAAPRRR